MEVVSQALGKEKTRPKGVSTKQNKDQIVPQIGTDCKTPACLPDYPFGGLVLCLQLQG